MKPANLIPSTSLKPCDDHEDLADERLISIGSIIKSVRLDCVDDHQPDKGDTNWGLGVKFLERLIHALNEFALCHDWFQVIEKGRHYVFLIGKVPCRAYRGLLNKPKPNMVKLKSAEKNARQEAFPFFQHRYEWRFILEVDPEDGSLQTLWFAQVEYYNKQWSVGISWPIPLDGTATQMTSINDLVRDAVEIEKPEAPEFRDVDEKKDKKESKND